LGGVDHFLIFPFSVVGKPTGDLLLVEAGLLS
jgi:hypothetical protein